MTRFKTKLSEKTTTPADLKPPLPEDAGIASPPIFDHGCLPHGITQVDILAIYDEYEARSITCASCFLEAAYRDLSFLSAMEFHKWADRGITLLDQPENGESLCSEFFKAGEVFFNEDMFHSLELWYTLALEIHALSPHAAHAFLQSTPIFLKHRKPFELKKRAQNTLNVLSCGHRRDKAAASFLKSSSKMHGFMFSLVFKEWLSTGLLIAEHSADDAIVFFDVDPDMLRELYQTETRIILMIVAMVSKLSSSDAVHFYQNATHDLLRVNPNIREGVLKSSIAISPRTENIPDSFATMVRALTPFSNPVQEGIYNHGKEIESLSKEAAGRYYQSVKVFLENIPYTFLSFWVEKGVAQFKKDDQAGVRYFSLSSLSSLGEYNKWKAAVRFEEVKDVLTIFADALCGRYLRFTVREEGILTQTTGKGLYPDGDGYTIGFPPYMAEGETQTENYLLYKIFAAHHAGYIEFNTFAPEFEEIWFLLKAFPHKELALDIFYIVEDGRIDNSLKREYPGLAPEMDSAVEGMVAKRCLRHDFAVQTILEILLRITLNVVDNEMAADDLVEHYVYLDSLLAGFYRQETTIYDVFIKTSEIYSYISPFAVDVPYASIAPLPVRERPNPLGSPGGHPLAHLPDNIMEGGSEDAAAEFTLPPEELAKLLQEMENIKTKKSQEEASANGLYISGLDHVISEGSIQDMKEEYKKYVAGKRLKVLQQPSVNENKFMYDEWDYLQGEYRSKWCCLREKDIAGQDPLLYYDIYHRYHSLIGKVKRQFQQIRPALLETVRGVEQGDELYMPAVIQGVVDKKSGNTPTERIFVRKEKKIRRISTLLLMDMSASTGEDASSLSLNHTSVIDGEDMDKRVIDIEIESLVVVIEALNALDDEYAVYGFSGQGKDKVDFYRIKDFKDVYSDELKLRVSGIEPKQSTRMGTAIRHAYTKLRNVNSDHRLLILLSDGFPQDLDYGEDRKTREYGLNDTMMALVEAAKEGIKTFCITIDQAGNDYLRKMCNPGNYLVIKDIYSLPEILPKVVESLMV